MWGLNETICLKRSVLGLTLGKNSVNVTLTTLSLCTGQLATLAFYEQLEVASWLVVYTLCLSGVMTTHSHSPRCVILVRHIYWTIICFSVWHFFPPSLPFGKVIFHTFHLLFTKHLLSTFSVPGSNTKMNKPHPCAQDAPSAEETTLQTAMPISLLPRDSSLPFLLPSLEFEPLHALLPLFWLPISNVIKIEVMGFELERPGFDTQLCL